MYMYMLVFMFMQYAYVPGIIHSTCMYNVITCMYNCTCMYTQKKDSSLENQTTADFLIIIIKINTN